MSSSAVAHEAAAPADDAQDGSPGTERLWKEARKQLPRTFWLWPALLTLGLGVRGSWRPELWRDELATWSAATRSTGQLIAVLHHVDAVSGAYYLLMHYWVSAFGDSPTVFRLPSALAMAGAAALVALTARKQFGVPAGLVAGLLFAVLPSVSRFAQEARSYAFAVLAVAAATYLLLRALERPDWQRWLPYGAAVAAAGLFHMVSLSVLAPHAVVAGMRWWRQRRRALLIGFPATVAAALLPVVPLVILGHRQVGRQISWLQSPTFQQFSAVWHGLFQSSLVGGCVLCLVALPAAWPKGRRAAFEIGLVAALPIVLIWYVSQGHTAYFLDRYLLFTVPAWAVLAGAGLTALRPRALIAIGLVGTAWIGLQDQQHLRERNSHELADERGAARIIAQGYRPGDGMAPVRGDQSYMMLNFAIEYYLPRSVQPKDVFAEESPVQHKDLYAVECPQPAACAAGVPRIWVVDYTDPDQPFKGFSKAQQQVLETEYTKVESKHVSGITVTLLQRQH
ncbi:glycosyltransferase family 39 protein [Kitasatospora sp. RB6PN24]|uniref:glycosyltransferase family 39 protein n=1 Tax=Kitasatospora humi TaxID=2893891 RepID=UPI001E29B6A5|nr:glycosyltransferase family 39 protein [Kitasatospora humi]MCC9310542.1 glycosyltransferase family 39 protein [Kitasatospora humi]